MMPGMLQRFAAYRVLRTGTVAFRAFSRYRRIEGRGDGAARSAHEQTAQEIHDLATELEGLFIKLAQVMGGREDVLPEPYGRILGRFHDRVPPRPFRELERAASRALGRRLRDVFRDIDETPLASASLAQVHRARLLSGAEVVLKIQYPEIARLVRIDLGSMRRIGTRFDRRFGGIVSGADVIEEMAHFLGLELDFTCEAASTERIRKAFEGDERIRVPQVHAQHSSRTLLVLEYLEGTPLTDTDRLRKVEADLPAFARRIAELYAAMIFELGFFHGDPHPGNLLLLPNNVVGLLDFGLAKELPDKFGSWMAALIVRGVRGDREGALEAARALGFNIDELSPALLADIVEQAMGRRPTPEASTRAEPAPWRERRAARNREQARLRKLAEGGERLQIPHHFALIGRTMALLNGLSERLAPGQRVMQQTMREVLAPYALAVASGRASS
jgi:ubiquinone biosynthesis protein